MQPNIPISRRGLLAGSVALAATTRLDAATPVPIIDTHIHLFDPNRPEGATYRGPPAYYAYNKGAFPADYARLSARWGVIGAIKVEASARPEDNDWVLGQVDGSDFMVGMIANLRPEAEDFLPTLTRYARNPRFRGIRYGNLWKYDIAGQSREPRFLAGLKALSDADLVLDTANPRVDLLQALVRINDAVPDLRIIIDHLPKLEPTPAERHAYEAVLREIATRPNLSVKLSAVIHPVDGKVSTRLADHRRRLDDLFALFGEDRVLFGSDWPNVEGDTRVENVFAIVRAYFSGRSRAQQEKYFWRNSVAIYKWQPRSPAQRALVARL